jgi:uncharacterized membrane protein YdbT with pleckstrin-like domain
LIVSLAAIAGGVALDVGVPHTSVALHWVEGLVVAVPCLWLLLRVMRWRTTRLVLTSLRLVEQRGLVIRRRSETALADIAAVTVVQPLVRRIVGTGRLEVERWDDDVRWIDDVRKPVVLARVITRRLGPSRWSAAGGG